MAYYKYPDGPLYFLSDEDIANGGLAMIPVGYTELSNAEAAELQKPAPMTTDELATAARAKRDALLTACDWTVLPDSPLSTEKQSEWKTYRQALRDVTEQEGFPSSIGWPEAPQ